MPDMRASIIIRAYNAEATLARAIRSALNQNYQNAYEVVVVNDGSNDGTAQVIQSFLTDPRVRVFNQENRGLIGASNTGFAAARADIVMLLDSDDEALPDFVSISADALADSSIDYAYGEYFEEYESERKIIRPSGPFKAPAGAFVWRREKLIIEGRFASGSMFPEYEILLRTWGKWKGVRISLPLFVYHRSKSSMTGNGSHVRDSIDILRGKYPERAAEIASIRSYDL